MFRQIFLFELKYRLRRLDIYLYFLALFIFAFFTFANGAVPASDGSYINAPLVLTKYFIYSSLMMMIVTAAVMGTPLYRDIEYNTHVYFLSYSLSKGGYYWGRWLASFLLVVIIALAIVFGSLAGTVAGPGLGWVSASRIGPYRLMNYLQPFLAFMIPNLLLTSSLFFALVARTRNPRAVYAGGLILYMVYMMSIFVFRNAEDKDVVYLLDAFGLNPVRLRSRFFTPAEENSSFVAIKGMLLVNRLLWTLFSVLVAVFSFVQFTLEKFLAPNAGKKERSAQQDETGRAAADIPEAPVLFAGNYLRNALLTLTGIELSSIIRDNYFRLVVGAATAFLGFIFWVGFAQRYDVKDLPRTVVLMDIYMHNFLLFVFILLLFYTGEVVHREKLTRFSVINDALPPSNRVFYSSKLLALLCISFLFATIPMVVGLTVQLLKGFHDFNFPIYFMTCYGISWPLFIESIFLAFAVHVLINNKFVGHAAGLMIWVLMLLGIASRRVNYMLFLYSYTPDYALSDMDGISPTSKPLFWFNVYWSFAAGLLLIAASLCFNRGVISSLRERMRSAAIRFNGRLRLVCGILFGGFILTGGYIYFNVSYLNTYLTYHESEGRSVQYERQLQRYENDPLPSIEKVMVSADIFPAEQKIVSKARIGIRNRTLQPLSTLLVDGSKFRSYTLKCNGLAMKYESPLLYSRAAFSVFSAALDTSMCRLYRFEKPLGTGDTAEIEVESSIENKGFGNGISGTTNLHNGVYFTDAIPFLGYDPSDELASPFRRSELGLPNRVARSARNNPVPGAVSGSPEFAGPAFEATISTSGDQVAVAPGKLQAHWVDHGRNYYRYALDSGSCFPFAIASARYALFTDSVTLFNGKKVRISIYYHPSNNHNLTRFLAACRDGLDYFSRIYGPYPFDEIRLMESSSFNYVASYPGMITIGENYGWNADFRSPGLFDYCYFTTAMQLARQWWMVRDPVHDASNTGVISEGVPKLSALLLWERKVGKNCMPYILRSESSWYALRRQFGPEPEAALIHSNQDFVTDTKAGLILYYLSDLIGKDKITEALWQFRQSALLSYGTHTGDQELYRMIKKQIPDSLQYYWTDSWEKVTVYDNKLMDVSVTPLSSGGDYKVHVRFSVNKYFADSAAAAGGAQEMDDLVELGIFAADFRNDNGYTENNPLFLKKIRLARGEHTMDIVVHGRPIKVGIDPYNELIDRLPDDNMKVL